MATRTRKIDDPRLRSEPSDSEADASNRASPFYDGSITRLIGWPVEIWLRCQAGMLKAAEPAATGWIGRRMEAATAALNAFERLAASRDFHDVAAIQREWFEGAVKRLDSELRAFADHGVALSHEAMIATRDAARTSSEVVGLATQAALHQQEEAIEQAA